MKVALVGVATNNEFLGGGGGGAQLDGAEG